MIVGAAIAVTLVHIPAAEAKRIRCPRSARISDARRLQLEQQLRVLQERSRAQGVEAAPPPAVVFPLYRCPTTPDVLPR